jgi:hypothetical protein
MRQAGEKFPAYFSTWWLAMAIDIGICNLALSHIGKGAIQNIDEGSTEAQQCALHYDQCRKELLGGNYDWSFSRSRQSLAQETTNLRSDIWGYAYAKPANFIRVIVPKAKEPNMSQGMYYVNQALANFSARSSVDITMGDYEIASDGLIYTNLLPVFMNYVEDKVNAGDYTPGFIAAFSFGLSGKIAYALTRDSGVTKMALERAEQMRSKYEAADANNDGDTAEYMPPHLLARA